MRFAYTIPLLLFLLMLSGVHFSLAQTKEIDSLKRIVETAQDTTQISALRNLGIKTRSYDKDKALEYLMQSTEKSREMGSVRGEIKALYAIALTHGMTGSYAESLDFLNRCLLLAQKHQDFKRICYIYNSFGIVYKRIGDYPKSQSYYLKRIELIDSLGLNMDKATPYVNLGILYSLMKEQDKAIESYEKALLVQIGDKEDRESLENVVMSNLAEIDFENGNYEAALEKLLKVSAYHKKIDNNIELSNDWSNIGNCYVGLKQWTLAHDYYIKSLNLAQRLTMKQGIATAQYKLADLMFRQKKYKAAIVHVNKSIDALDGFSGHFEKRDVHEVAYKVYEAAGQHSKAIYHLNQTMAYRDSLLNETKVREIQNLQVQHDVYQKDKEIKENELQLALLNTQVSLNNKRMVYLGIIAFLLLFSAALLYFRFRAKKRANRLLRNKNMLISQQNLVIEDMNLKMEKQMLRAQMNPHFIFNSLNSIQHLINTDDRVNALKYLSKFSKLLRQVLESSINVSLVLKDEIELLKIYLELESLRFDNSFTYEINVNEGLDVNEHEVPMLLVQPYIENAIIHGLMPKDGQKDLTITFDDLEDFIQCTIEDNGVGFKPNKKNAPSSKIPSRGMSITQQRIKTLEKFSRQELLKIEHLNDGTRTGTRVTILIPKQKFGENLFPQEAV